MENKPQLNTSLMPQLIIAVLFVVGFIGVLWMTFGGDITLTDTNEKLAHVLIGILSSILLQIMNFFFSSSAGSKEKSAQAAAIRMERNRFAQEVRERAEKNKKVE